MNFNDDDELEEDERSFLFLLIMFFYYILIGICFFAIFALLTITVKSLIINEVYLLPELLVWMAIPVIILSILFIINKQSVFKGFEYVAFGKFRGIPVGMAIIGLFLYIMFDSLLLRLFNIGDNTFIQVTNFIISMFISLLLYDFLSFCYFDKKKEK